MPLRRALAVFGLCLLCGPLAAQTCDQAPLPPPRPVKDMARVRKAIDEVSKLQTPYQAVPVPAFPTDPDQRDEAVADWNHRLEDFKAKNYYKKTEDLDQHRHTGKIPCYHDVMCDENVIIVSPGGPRVTLSAGEFHYFVVHQQITEENLAAIEALFKPRDQALAAAALKPAKVSAFQRWFHRSVKDLGQDQSGASR